MLSGALKLTKSSYGQRHLEPSARPGLCSRVVCHASGLMIGLCHLCWQNNGELVFLFWVGIKRIALNKKLLYEKAIIFSLVREH